MKVEINESENTLVITLPLHTPVLLKSEKTLVVAATYSNKKTDVLIDGKPLTVSVNAYIRK